MVQMENAEHPRTLADRLRWARERKNWSQSHLALVADVSTSTVGMIESGARQNKGSLPALADALGVRYKWLMFGELPVTSPKQEPIEPFVRSNSPEGFTAVKIGTAVAKPAAPMDEEVERRLAGFMALLGHLPPDRRKAALVEATQVLVDHLPLPATGG